MDECPASPGSGQPHKQPGKRKEFPVGVVVAVLLIVSVILLVVGWGFYAYTHPHSKSGQWLIEVSDAH